MEDLAISIFAGYLFVGALLGVFGIIDDMEYNNYFSIITFCIFGIIAGLLIFVIVSEEDKPKQQIEIVMFADVNQDGEIDISDMAIIKSHLLGIRQMNEQQLKIADVNKDGEINQIDLEIIRAVILSSNGYKYEFNN